MAASGGGGDEMIIDLDATIQQADESDPLMPNGKTSGEFKNLKEKLKANSFVAKDSTKQAWWQQQILHHTSIGELMLWNTFIFWLYVIIARSTEATLKKWPTALGIAVIVGMILNVNAFAMFKANRAKLVALQRQLDDGDADRNEAEGLVMLFLKTNVSSIFRFFFIPFGVSTYTATMTGNSTYFWYIFPSGKVGPLPDMALAAIILVSFTIVMLILRHFVQKLAKQDVDIEIDVECVAE
jgi:hypothetical protein